MEEILKNKCKIRVNNFTFEQQVRDERQTGYRKIPVVENKREKRKYDLMKQI